MPYIYYIGRNSSKKEGVQLSDPLILKHFSEIRHRIYKYPNVGEQFLFLLSNNVGGGRNSRSASGARSKPWCASHSGEFQQLRQENTALSHSRWCRGRQRRPSPQSLKSGYRHCIPRLRHRREARRSHPSGEGRFLHFLP